MKFIITRTDGQPVPPEARFFVLRCDGSGPKRAAARGAVFEFAALVSKHDPAASKTALCLALETMPTIPNTGDFNHGQQVRGGDNGRA